MLAPAATFALPASALMITLAAEPRVAGAVNVANAART